MKPRLRPVVFVWDGDHMVPLPRFKHLCDRQFAVHEEYPLMIVENRSMASHRHFFAAVHEGWANLAEEYAGRFPSSEHLRAWALVEAGYSSESVYAMDSAKDAMSLAKAIRAADDLVIIRVSGDVVKVFRPMSQSVAAMKKDPFEASKKAVLEIVASMARTTPAELTKNAGRSA